MLWVKAFHVIFMVTWFSGLFYLPRLFVYHAEASDKLSIDRFKTMERRLYYCITFPGAVLTTLFGIGLLSFNLTYYLHAPWMHAKLSLVILVWIYHFFCGHYVKAFKNDENQHSSKFFRFFNEISTVFFVAIVILVIVKP